MSIGLYEKATNALRELMVTADRNMIKYAFMYPEASDNQIYSYAQPIAGQYEEKDIHSTAGMWAGIYYNLYSATKDIRYYHYADTISKSVAAYIEKRNMNATTVGQIALLSMMYRYKHNNSRSAKKALSLASASMLTNYLPQFECISVWGDSIEHDKFNIKVDDLIDYMLLRWLHREERGHELASIINKSVDKILEYIVESDEKIYSRYYFDTLTGAPIGGYYCLEHNEYTNVTRFSLNVSYTLFGMALHYAVTSEKRYLEVFLRLAKPFLETYDEKGCYSCIGGNLEYDTKATLIAICAIMELKNVLTYTDADIDMYYNKALAMLEYIIDNKRISPDRYKDGFVSGCIRYYFDIYTNVSTVTADYFFLEALLRYLNKYTGLWY